MKKCASCSKDLPEAALHCVFCGAKQAAAPAVQPGLAKTAFGYSANEVMQQLGNQPGQPYQPPQAQPYQPPRPQSGSQPPPIGGQPYQPPGGYQPPPSAAAHAPTMMVGPGGGPPAPQQQAYTPAGQGYGVPQPGYVPPAQQGYGGGGGYGPPGGGMGIHSPPQPTPAPIPAVQSPYMGSQSSAQAGRPIEPWKDSLRFMMFVWGGIALAAFATPLMTDPMAFNWDVIIHGAGKEKIPPLVWAAVSVLSITIGGIPMASLPRGILAAVLGLAGIFVPMAITEGAFKEWQTLLPLVGMLALIPGLLVRHEYVESLLARVLVTIGAVCVLLPYLIPDHGQIPLVLVFKALINAGSHMEIVIYALAQIVLAVLCLLVWMPGPATAGAKIFAWVWILFPVAKFALDLLGGSHVGDMISKSPALLMVWAPGVAYTVLVGYGGATVIGKQLE